MTLLHPRYRHIGRLETLPEMRGPMSWIKIHQEDSSSSFAENSATDGAGPRQPAGGPWPGSAAWRDQAPVACPETLPAIFMQSTGCVSAQYYCRLSHVPHHCSLVHSSDTIDTSHSYSSLYQKLSQKAESELCLL